MSKYTNEDLKFIITNDKLVEESIKRKLSINSYKIISSKLVGEELILVVSFKEDCNELYVHNIQLTIEDLQKHNGLLNIVKEKYEWHTRTLTRRIEYMNMQDELRNRGITKQIRSNKDIELYKQLGRIL